MPHNPHSFSRHPRALKSLHLARVFWFTLLGAGVLLAFAIPPLAWQEDIGFTLALAAFVNVILSFIIPQVVETHLRKSAPKIHDPRFLERSSQIFVLTHLLSFALSETALLMALVALGGLHPYVRLGLILAYGVLMAVHYPNQERLSRMHERFSRAHT